MAGIAAEDIRTHLKFICVRRGSGWFLESVQQETEETVGAILEGQALQQAKS